MAVRSPATPASEAKGAACALLSVRTLPTDEDADGTYLGVVGVGFAPGATPETSVHISNGIKNLKNGVTPIGLDILGDSVTDLGAAVTALVDDSTRRTPLPLLGEDASAGSWLTPVLEELGVELRALLSTDYLTTLPQDALVNDLNGDGTSGDSLAAALRQATTDAVGRMQETHDSQSIDMADILDSDGDGTPDITVKVLCGEGSGGACADGQTLGDVQDIKLGLRIGKEEVYQVPFQAGLSGLPISADFRVNSEVEWSLGIEVGVSRKTGGYVDVAPSDLKLKAEVNVPDKGGSETCPDSPVTGAFTDPSPFSGYEKDRCQSITLGLLQATAYDAKGADRSRLGLDLSLQLDKVFGTGEQVAAKIAEETAAGDLDHSGTKIVADGRLNMYFVTGINPNLPNLQAGSLPSVHGVIDIKFNEDEVDLRDLTADAADGLWSIDYRSLYLDAGSFVNEFAGPGRGRDRGQRQALQAADRPGPRPRARGLRHRHRHRR